MNGALLGAKLPPLPTDQIVVPAIGLPASSVQLKGAPPQSCTSMPRCFLYQAPSAAGSLALKKMPPMPVTRFMRSPFAVARSAAASPADRRLDRAHVDLLHRHHRIERALGDRGVRVGVGVDQDDGGDLPGQAPPVLAPAAIALLAAVADDRVPIAVGLGL